MLSPVWPRILSEDLAPPAEPLSLLFRAHTLAPPKAVARSAARAILGTDCVDCPVPAWLAPHQVPAARRLAGIIARYGGALLADAPGLGKSYVAVAVALVRGESFGLVVPSVLRDQWRALLDRHSVKAPILTHEALSSAGTFAPTTGRLLIVDEAHRFRNPDTNRYRALSRLAVGRRLLLVTATPVHNAVADLLHLFRLFLRDDALTALGVPSLSRATAGDSASPLVTNALARFTVARSRRRVTSAYGEESRLTFPARAPGRVIVAGSLIESPLEVLTHAIVGLRSGLAAAPLFRLLLLTRLASSVAALQESLRRYEAFLELGLAAAAEGRSLGPKEFGGLFAERGQDAIQLALFPILLEAGTSPVRPDDLRALAELRRLPTDGPDPKADALEAILDARARKTIVFAGARATVRYLTRRFRSRRTAAVVGDHGLLAGGRASTAEVLRAFAPRSQGAVNPPAALETDLLIATDLLSEGLSLQDAARVVHYDIPWSPARLAQRVGRIDRLGSTEADIETVTFLPPPVLAEALRLEERHARKIRAQLSVSTAQVEGITGPASHGLDWCDRLHALATARGACAPVGGVAAVAGDPAVVLVIRLGALVEAVVVDDSGARADSVAATDYLERAVGAEAVCVDGQALTNAIERAAPLVRARLDALAAARWRAADRDGPGRRLIASVLAAARSTARRGDARELGKLDALISRLAAGMTAGEERLLADLLERETPLSVRDLLTWHEGLPPLGDLPASPDVELVAAVVGSGAGAGAGAPRPD